MGIWYFLQIFWKDGLSIKITLEYDLSCIIRKYTPKIDISSVTEKDDSCPRKDDISILDWHSRRSFNDSLYFYRDLFQSFICCFPMKKPKKKQS